MGEQKVVANTPVYMEDGSMRTEAMEYILSGVFRTSQTGMTDLNGKKFRLIKVIDSPDKNHDIECLPMFMIDVDGEQVEAFLDEVTDL